MMFEKVNPMHPDKIADRIAGAMVDLAYKKEENPRIAVEVLIGHGKCHIIAETSVHFTIDELQPIVDRISGEKNVYVDYKEVPQDPILAKNQDGELRCGDNGIFKGCIRNIIEDTAVDIVRETLWLDAGIQSDGKFVFYRDSMSGLAVIVACQSKCHGAEVFEIISERYEEMFGKKPKVIVNPLGEWTGGINVDAGATNRKLGSDMGRAVTGGGLHGKDLSKADVSVNIYCHILANEYGRDVEAFTAIGDTMVEFRIIEPGQGAMARSIIVPFSLVIERARKYIDKIGGFEALANWGLIR